MHGLAGQNNKNDLTHRGHYASNRKSNTLLKHLTHPITPNRAVIMHNKSKFDTYIVR